MVLDALDYFKVHKDIEVLRYQRLVTLLGAPDRDWDLKAQVMLFVNQLMNAEDLEERVIIRAEFLTLRLESVIEVWRGSHTHLPLHR